MTTQLGFALRDAALAQSQRGREERIQRVRDYLLDAHDHDTFGDYPTLTGDSVMNAVEALGFTNGDHRWTANVLKGWDAVTPTVNFVPSRRKERRGAPLRVWRWK